MRTLVISDLHIGSRLGHSVLGRPEPLRRLLSALSDVDRLVLLGDIVELMEGRAGPAIATAEPLIRSIGERLGHDREVVIVPGNHDRPLVLPWLRQTRARMTVDTEIPTDATNTLARLSSWLGPARVRVHYPGVWLAPRVWATHGHYLDVHLMPRSAFGFRRGPLSRLPRDEVGPDVYERARRPSAARASRWMPRPVAELLNDAAELARVSTMPRVRRHLLRPETSPLTSRLLGFQMRRASIPALARVVHRLGVDADWVVFGHVHRTGPLADDDPADWLGPDGRLKVVNTGAWLYEPRLVHGAIPPHPYWPGGAALLEDGGPPRAIGLLDELDAARLH